MIRIGTAGAPHGCRSSEEGVRKVHELGLSAMEVEFVRGVKMGPDTAEAVGAVAKELGVQLSVHAPYYINLNAAESEKLEASKGRVLDSLRIGDILSATVVVVHAGFYLKDEKEKATADIKEAVEAIADIRNENAWKPLIGLESMGKEGTWGKLDELSAVVAADGADGGHGVDGVVPVLDFAHYHALTQGGLKKEEDFGKYMGWYEKVTKNPMHAHFSGINYGLKGELNHLPIDSREPDYSKLVPVLKRKKYDITLISESPLIEEDALKFQEMLNEGMMR